MADSPLFSGLILLGDDILLFTKSLKKNYQFRFVYNRGKSIANKFLVMYVVKNNSLENFIGISVSKKVGNSVVRSRVTRLIRESYRLNEFRVKNGYSIVVIARNTSNTASYKEIESAMIHLFSKHHLFKDKN